MQVETCETVPAIELDKGDVFDAPWGEARLTVKELRWAMSSGVTITTECGSEVRLGCRQMVRVYREPTPGEPMALPVVTAIQVWADREEDEAYARARRALQKARDEIDQLERELEKASEGKAYLRPGGLGGEITGLDVGKVALAFAAIETAARVRRMRQTEEGAA